MHLILQHFFESDHVVALLIAVLIFLTTIFLVVKRWIGFPIALLLLFFTLVTGIVINNQDALNSYLKPHSKTALNQDQDAFRSQIMQAVEGLKTEVETEKNNLRTVMGQVQEIFDHMEVQKQKLQNFIDETREHFKAENVSKSTEPTI